MTIITGVVCGDRIFDHEQFVEERDRIANGFLSLDIQGGGCVCLLMRNDITFLATQAAVIKAGGFSVLLNWHATADDIAYVLEDCDAKILVVHADLLGRVRSIVPDGCQILVVPTSPELMAAYKLSVEDCRINDEDTNWAEWVKTFKTEFVETSVNHNELGIYYTSGTTGRPKGIMRKPVDAEGAARIIGVADEVFGVESGESVRVLVSAPVYHAAPNFIANRGTSPGSLTVLQPRFDAEGILQLIERFQITHLYLVPTTIIKLLELPAATRNKYDISSLQRLLHAGAPCSISTKQRIIEWMGPVVCEFYGGTENGAVTLLAGDEPLKKPGSVGKLMNNCRLKVYDEDGTEVPAGEIGEVYARNFNLPKFSYRHLPEKQTEVERGDLITVGDIGYVDEDGYLFLCDRKRDLIISAGANIYPAEVEMILIDMPAVADCAVFGIPDDVFGESVCAHVEPMANMSLSPEDVIAWMKERVASYQVPRLVVIDTGLPREESGKIMKRKIRDKYWAEEGKSI